MSNLVLAACRSVLPSARFAGKSSLVSSGDRRRNTTCACGPSRPTRFDPMAMPLKAAHGHFAMLLHSKNPPPDMPKADREQFGRAEADASAPHQASLTFGSRKQARTAADFRTYPVTRKSNYLMIIFSPFPVYAGKISPPAASAACMLYYSSIWEKVQLQFCYRERLTPPEAPGRSPGPGP